MASSSMRQPEVDFVRVASPFAPGASSVAARAMENCGDEEPVLRSENVTATAISAAAATPTTARVQPRVRDRAPVVATPPGVRAAGSLRL